MLKSSIRVFGTGVEVCSALSLSPALLGKSLLQLSIHAGGAYSFLGHMFEAAGKLLLLECLGGCTEPVTASDLLGDSTSALWGNS